jgi:uncharacterized delta-60 repeat protein
MAGRIITDFSGSQDQANGVAVQPDGKIVAVGAAVGGLDAAFALARYNGNGSLDSSFGSGGKVTTAANCSSTAFAVVIQSNGKIVVGGQGRMACGFGFSGDFALARYNSNGSLDLSFGVSGKVHTDFSGLGCSANALAIQPDGKIVAAGVSFTPILNASVSPTFAVARYQGDGFDICLEDDSSGSLFQLNSTTGAYTSVTALTSA